MKTMPNREPERRRAPRVEVAGRTQGKIKQVVEASLINISAVGALVEHPQPLVIDQIYELTLSFEGRELTFRTRAVRSIVSSVQPLGGGRSKLIYRTGLEFLDARQEDVDIILRFVRKGSGGTSGLRVLLKVGDGGEGQRP